MKGVLEFVPSVPLQSRRHTFGQVRFIAYIPYSSRILAHLRSMVGEKRILSFFPVARDIDPPGSLTNMSMPFPWVFVLQKRTHLFMALGEDLPRARRACRRKTKRSSFCHRGKHSSGIRPLERSLCFTIEKTLIRCD